jgi:hypothetical protein
MTDGQHAIDALQLTPVGLAPRLDFLADCPFCHVRLHASGWLIPGMRALARAGCEDCGRAFLCDLPTGQALYSPVLMEAATGAVHDRAGVPWFAQWLRDSYRDRSSQPVDLTVETMQTVSRPVVLLNCIDALYGHALLKLLNAQQYIGDGIHDLVVIVQPFLRWLVPDGVAECWTVDIPLRRGTTWSDPLADRIAIEARRFEAVQLAPAFSHVHPSMFSIARFSRVQPFDRTEWRQRPARGATFHASFVWRDDRCWRGRSSSPTRASAPVARLRRWLGRRSGAATRVAQAGAIVALFDGLREQCGAAGASLDAAVVGVGEPGGLPDTIRDLRSSAVTLATEHRWCRRYAESHLVVGVHGSSMLLPSAHAGSVIELLPSDRHGNFLQDIIFNGTDTRDLFFRYRFAPLESAPAEIARLAALVLIRYPDFDRLMGAANTRDRSAADVRN